MSQEKITMPHLGEGITEATIVTWLKQPGEHVEQYEPLLEVITDKVTTEVPSLFTGVLKEVYYLADETVPMGHEIGLIETSENAAGNTHSLNQKDVKISSSNLSHLATRYSPAVASLAQENQLDLKLVTGSGDNGRITRKDVLDYLGSASRATDRLTSMTDYSARAQVKNDPINQQQKQKVSPVRRAIAENMRHSYLEIPHAWTMIEVDATNLVKLREEAKTAFKQEEGFNLTYLAFFIKQVAQALRKYPMLNSQWMETEIIHNQAINISIAVAANDLLYVPVIKAADEKSIKGIAREISQLAKKARQNKLLPSDSQGGTFTVNSTGSYGSIMSQGIINHPQVAILQVESIVKRPMFYNEGIAIRDMVNLCLSIDHRVLDGHLSGLFLQEIKQGIEAIDPTNFPIY